MTPGAHPLHQALLAHLTSKYLAPTPSWLNNFLSTQRPNIPLPALQKTALFRLQTSDITTTLTSTPATTFPPNILDAQVQSRVVNGPISVQVLEIEDVGRSRWNQVEAIESAERGETTKGREVVRVVPNEDGGDAVEANGAGTGPFKLLLQDVKGMRVYAFELETVEGVNASMAIGTKLVLRNVLVARGVVMMQAGTVMVLGGKIEGMEKMWREGRKERLRAGIDAMNGS